MRKKNILLFPRSRVSEEGGAKEQSLRIEFFKIQNLPSLRIKLG